MYLGWKNFLKLHLHLHCAYVSAYDVFKLHIGENFVNFICWNDFVSFTYYTSAL